MRFRLIVLMLVFGQGIMAQTVNAKSDSPIEEPKSLEELYQEAVQEKDTRQKIVLLTAILEKNDTYARAYYSRANALDDMGRMDEALSDYDKAIKIQPTFALAYNNRGTLKNKMKHYEDAVADFDKAIMLQEGFAEAYNNSGIAKRHLGEKKAALLDFEQALKIDSTYTSAYYNRALVKKSMKDYKDAMKDFEKVMELDAQDAYAPAAMGCMLSTNMDEHLKAVKYLKIALELDPEMGWAKDCLEDALARK